MNYDVDEMDVVSILRSDSQEFVKLENEHSIIKKRIEEIEKNRYLSPDEEVQKKELQKRKLRIKDQISRIITLYKS